MYKHILVATDGSELARKGLDHGLELAALIKAKVTVLTVSEPLRQEVARAAHAAGVRDPALRYDQQIEELMQERFAYIKQRAEQHGVTVELTHEVDDSPAEAIVRYAKLKDCDLIVMSARGRRGLRKILLGSQTAEVLVKTHVPVLVIH